MTRYSEATRIGSFRDEPISLASAEQRRGRAGRVAPGHCYRLWSASAPLSPEQPPEMLRAPCDEVLLAACVLGAPSRYRELHFHVPSWEALAQRGTAPELLRALNASCDFRRGLQPSEPPSYGPRMDCAALCALPTGREKLHAGYQWSTCANTRVFQRAVTQRSPFMLRFATAQHAWEVDATTAMRESTSTG